MNDLIFKVTPRRQFGALAHLVIVWSVLIPFFAIYGQLKFLPIYLMAYSFFFLTDFLPTLVVHIQYAMKNSGATLTVNRELKTIRYKSSSGEYSYSFNDIAALLHVASYGGGSWYSFSEYRYFKVTFNDGNEIIITSLMMPDIKYQLEMLLGISAKKKLRVLALIY